MVSWFAAQFRNSPSLYALWLTFIRLSMREQMLLLLMLFMLVLVGLYLALWQPVKQAHHDAQSSFDSVLQGYYQVVEKADVLREGSQQQPSQLLDRNVNELRDVINQTARVHNIVAERISLEGDSRMQIWLNDTPFSQVAAWLGALAAKKVTITSMQISSREVGVVSLRMTLD